MWGWFILSEESFVQIKEKLILIYSIFIKVLLFQSILYSWLATLLKLILLLRRQTDPEQKRLAVFIYSKICKSQNL